jgi:prepilin-type N-terminal cleavage/methylation domain-containing protein
MIRQAKERECETRTAERGTGVHGLRWALARARRGMTLIELLVTIAIMVTVLGAVIPLMSPNNNSRKIREASRQLNSFIQQAKAQAARDGRAAGVLLREFSTPPVNSGIALEVMTIAEPQPFAGFSDNSRVMIQLAGVMYGPAGNGGTRYAQYENYPVCTLNFVLHGGEDLFPPRMLRIGDRVEAAGNVFLICDDADPATMPNQLELDPAIPVENQPNAYLLSDPTVTTAPIPGSTLNAIWVNYRGQVLPNANGGTMYKIYRQPTITTAPPLQFPRGIGVDLAGSHATGVDGPDDFDRGGPTTVGLMFLPNGDIEGLYLDGKRHQRIDQVFLLLGLFENGNPGRAVNPDWENNYDFIANPATSRDDYNRRRSLVNWLHPDAQWVAVNSAGRAIVAEAYNSFDPTSPTFLSGISGTPEEQNRAQRNKQIQFSRQYAEQMQQQGGR